MNNQFIIEKQHVHLWSLYLPELLPYINEFFRLLNPEEVERAHRFRQKEHQERFILTRGILRQILQYYTSQPAETIQFHRGEWGKPYLSSSIPLQFNVSHSHEMAVYAFTMEAEIGVDIEKTSPRFNGPLAERFFSKEEYHALLALPDAKQAAAFYYLWAGKEAVIKAAGKGLHIPLSAFSLRLEQDIQTINFLYQQQEHRYHLHYFVTQADYQAALATLHEVKNIIYFNSILLQKTLS